MDPLLSRIIAHPDVTKQPNSRGEAQAWCPWHPDREGGKPSLGINVSKEIVKCWSCGVGGVKRLAKAWEIPIDDDPPPWKREFEATYDYRDTAGKLAYQVVRFRTSPGDAKEIAQRRPSSTEPGEWEWSLKGTKRVLYRLPELLAAPDDAWVFVVEGEKDADRLAGLGLTATTNPQGAGKWYKQYNPDLKGRRVAIIPDNDRAGMDHAQAVAASLEGVAKAVRLVELSGLPEDGDVSDWLDASEDRTADVLREFVDLVPDYETPLDGPPAGEPNGENATKHREPALAIIAHMKTEGFFVKTVVDWHYYFHRPTRSLILIERDEPELRVFLNDRYSVNRQDILHLYLVEQMVVEARLRGQEATVATFSYYDRDARVVYLDMGEGRLLRVNGKSIEYRDNGADGVLFALNRRFQPWRYTADVPENILIETLIRSLSFDDTQTHTEAEQRLLMLAWLLSLAFETLQPTKPIAVALGPSGSGKSNFFRRVGRLLFGPQHENNVARRGEKGEQDFWNVVTNKPFACFDNVDLFIPWIEDALAVAATGIEHSTRKLHTTNELATYVTRCFLAITARTPKFRREDVASRLLIFRLNKLETKRRESDVLAEIDSLRDQLMSDYVRLIRRVVAMPYKEPNGVDPSIRLADFAGLASWIGSALGAEVEITSALNKMQSSQFAFATEEADIAVLLEEWLEQIPEGQLAGVGTNEGRKIRTKDLNNELQAVADHLGMKWRFSSPQTLGTHLSAMQEALSVLFEIETGHGKGGNWWTFRSEKQPENES